MCGKFTTLSGWTTLVALERPMHTEETEQNRRITFRVMSNLPVIVWDAEMRRRRILTARWGFPHRADPNRPDPIHVRAETIDEKPTFREAFHQAQRGIVIVRSFNEGLELANGKTEQHTILLGAEGAVGIAFLWRRFELAGGPLYACVMATVPANSLIGAITDRMPAVLAPEDWGKWLGEEPATPEEAKACLKTVEGLSWTMNREKPPTR